MPKNKIKSMHNQIITLVHIIITLDIIMLSVFLIKIKVNHFVCTHIKYIKL